MIEEPKNPGSFCNPWSAQPKKGIIVEISREFINLIVDNLKSCFKKFPNSVFIEELLDILLNVSGLLKTSLNALNVVSTLDVPGI